ncbi:hypothetical protein CONLIGDRAFT_262092 [Coniochaeta ligniaria NRRL 30616]|uniref:Uncharacterized protein n=1 Tax=Coniochaeta ligniaria NRRL 30616 TaxID=1408157 RepID=A0A1J7JQL7_9PEZI|nr:hypothetical protein CONLIGDRAFT_262092 [Coniochaeta ligniaria NRRL 30616]
MEAIQPKKVFVKADDQGKVRYLLMKEETRRTRARVIMRYVPVTTRCTAETERISPLVPLEESGALLNSGLLLPRSDVGAEVDPELDPAAETRGVGLRASTALDRLSPISSSPSAVVSSPPSSILTTSGCIVRQIAVVRSPRVTLFEPISCSLPGYRQDIDRTSTGITPLLADRGYIAR